MTDLTHPPARRSELLRAAEVEIPRGGGGDPRCLGRRPRSFFDHLSAGAEDLVVVTRKRGEPAFVHLLVGDGMRYSLRPSLVYSSVQGTKSERVVDMTMITERATVSSERARRVNPGSTRVYAIAFDMDTKALEEAWGNENWRNAYGQIKSHLANYGFSPQQGSVYFGNAEVTPVTTVIAVQSLAEAFDWFAPSVKDIRMLRIEEDNDLLPAINAVVPIPPRPRPAPAEGGQLLIFDQGEPVDD